MAQAESLAKLDGVKDRYRGQGPVTWPGPSGRERCHCGRASEAGVAVVTFVRLIDTGEDKPQTVRDDEDHRCD